MDKNTKKTSSKLASKAAKALQDDKTSKIGKKLAGSVLAQADKDKETGADMENLASKVMRSKKYSEQNKSFAASVVSQANKERHMEKR